MPYGHELLGLRQLTERDTSGLQALLEADPEYARRVTGQDPGPEEAIQLLSARPSGMEPSHKFVFGVEMTGDAERERGGLLAVIDVLRGWPHPSSAHIGLLQVHTSRKRQGVGERAHRLLLDRVSTWPEIDTLRAAIVATNAASADGFWAALGYQPSGPPKPYRAGDVDTYVRVWTLPLHRNVAHTGGLIHESRDPSVDAVIGGSLSGRSMSRVRSGSGGVRHHA